MSKIKEVRIQCDRCLKVQKKNDQSDWEELSISSDHILTLYDNWFEDLCGKCVELIKRLHGAILLKAPAGGIKQKADAQTY